MALQGQVRNIANNLGIIANAMAVMDDELDDGSAPAAYKNTMKARLKVKVDAQVTALQAVSSALT